MTDVQDTLDVAHEVATFKEWNRIQQNLLTSIAVLRATHKPARTWRSTLEDWLDRSTNGRARIYWELSPKEGAQRATRCFKVQYDQTHYGQLELAPGFLESRLLPDIPQTFAHLLGVLVSLVEHRSFVSHLLTPLPPRTSRDRLTVREHDVLVGLARGESELSTARRLGVELTTIRTHRHRLYQSLEVHDPQAAVVRGFALRLLDWLDIP